MTAGQAPLNLGLLANTSIQLSHLETIVTSAKFSVTAAMLTRSENLNKLPNVDIWVVRIDLADERSQAFVDRLDGLDVPVIYDDADSYSSLDIAERAKRFSKKIEACVYPLDDSPRELSRAKYMWVLAASAGGPEAVASFLKTVPLDLEEVAFIYAQHMDENMAEALIKTLLRSTDWQVSYAQKASVLRERSVYLIPPSFQFEINESGMLLPLSVGWEGPYRPSIDQVVAKVWRAFGKNSGAIVFSGMGDDGAKTCKMIKNTGGQVWVQTPESCAVDSMPREVMNTQCVSYSGTPEQLARHFVAYHKKQTLRQN